MDPNILAVMLTEFFKMVRVIEEGKPQEAKDLDWARWQTFWNWALQWLPQAPPKNT